MNALQNQIEREIAVRHRHNRINRVGVAAALATAVTLATAAAAVAQTTRTERADLVIGAPLPLTGPRAADGEAVLAALRAAVDDFNRLGGVLGRDLRLEIVDDGCDGKTAEQAATALLELAPAVVVGHICGSAGIAGARVYAPAGILHISPGVRHPRFTDSRPGDSILRLAGRDDRQGYEAGRTLSRAVAASRIVLVHDRTALARQLVADARTAISDAGQRVLAVETLVAGEKDYGVLVGRLLAAEADAIFLAAFPAEAAMIARAFRDAGGRSRLLGGDILADPYFAEAAGRAADAVHVLVPGIDRKATRAEALLARIAGAAPGATAWSDAVTAYAALETWRQAVVKSGTLETAKLVATLYSEQFETVAGPIRFDRKGDASVASYTLMEWRDGKLGATR